MIEMNYDETVTILSEIIEEFGPETVYQKRAGRCNYVHDGQPDCLVGKFLARVGVPVVRLMDADKYTGSGQGAAGLLGELKKEEVLTVDDRGHFLLTEVQYRQDQSETWGDSLRQAQRYATGE